MQRILFFLFSILIPLAAFAEVSDANGDTRRNDYFTPPPKDLPVIVEGSFYLWNISDVDEKKEAYSCEFYLMLSWNDARLAFDTQDTPLIYSEEAAVRKLNEIWWPELDFVNASSIEQRNRSLFIYPSGKVEYSLKVMSTIYTPMDFRLFPFDIQHFDLNIESFLWDSSTLQFVTKKENIGFLPAKEVRNMYLVEVESDISDKKFPYMTESYSNFGVILTLQRHSGFFNFQILIPLVVVLLINCAMFFLDVDDLSTRLYLSQGSILIFVAMKFMINENLPNIDYLTLIDYVFFIAYFCCCIATLISCLNFYLWKKKNIASKRMNKAGIAVPIILFLILYLIMLFWAKVI
jgi:hypothetical protein